MLARSPAQEKTTYLAIPMALRITSIISIIFVFLFPVFASAQTVEYDTFIRKDGIYAPGSFDERGGRTLFCFTDARKKTINPEATLGKPLCDRVKYYLSPSFGKTEPYTYFRTLRDLQAHDSTAYFDGLIGMPSAYQQFFRALYLVEENQFKKAYMGFDNISATDSLLTKETVFWKDALKGLVEDEIAYSSVINAYKLLAHPVVSGYARLDSVLAQIQSPYLQHRYIVQFNYHFRLRDYVGARQLYDSIVVYTTQDKMKASLIKNRGQVLDMLEAKNTFMAAMKKQLYHYELDFITDHLDAWGSSNITMRDELEDAGFTLNPRFTNKIDSFYTRWLMDTAEVDTKSKFEVLSFVKTPFDKSGRRFVMVKLGFDRDETFQIYEKFLQRFKSKPIEMSLMANNGPRREGNEYMLTKYFIASLYKQQDPVIKYELCLYLLEDKEGNAYAVDTSF